MMKILLAFGLALATAAPLPASATEAERAAITAALTRWTYDFNARRTDKVCDLFAHDLRSDYRGQPEQTYETLCAQLTRSLTDPARGYAYALDLKEILVSGEVAIVRLVWTLKLTIRAEGREIVTREPGLDVFRREADGKWRITRFMAYEE